MIRAAQFDAQHVIVRLKPTDSGQSHLLTVESTTGVSIHDLTRPYADPRQAELAYRGMCTLFAAGYTVAAVIAFAQQVNPDTTTTPEILPTPCEVAA